MTPFGGGTATVHKAKYLGATVAVKTLLGDDDDSIWEQVVKGGDSDPRTSEYRSHAWCLIRFQHKQSSGYRNGVLSF